jgi:HTH-type transcriptional regulator, glycine betaine synthesis regulator
MLWPVKRNSLEALTVGTAPLNAVEQEVIHLFVQLSRALNQPPSVAEIYGLLFVSPRPLPQDEFYDRLNMSKGAASMGLRYLLDLGAVRTVYVAKDRRVHYEAVAELRNLASRFVRQQILHNFEDSGTRLARIAEEAEKLDGEQRDFAMARAEMLKSWEKNVKRVLPILLTVLGGDKTDN